jgi:putative transposase
MARPLRIEYPGAWHHVMNRGRHKQAIYLDSYDYQIFLKLMGQCTELFGLEFHAFSLMPNHYHLLVRTPLANLSRGIRHLNGVFTQKMNVKYDFDGALFRGRFKSILIEEATYLLEVVRYIHRNPLKAGLVKTITKHPWTSHAAYLSARDRLPWLKTETILNHFSINERTARIAFDHFVCGAPSPLSRNKSRANS